VKISGGDPVERSGELIVGEADAGEDLEFFPEIALQGGTVPNIREGVYLRSVTSSMNCCSSWLSEVVITRIGT